MGEIPVDHMLLRALVAALLLAGTASADCPGVLDTARRLLVVTTPDMTAPTGTGQLWKRAPGADWQPVGGPVSMTVGRNGLGWSHDQTALARGAEPVKREGDGRTPAGIFAAGDAFGTGPSLLPKGHRRTLTKGTACVDDVRSPAYNTITVKPLGNGISHEKMWTIPQYRQGLVIRNATSAAKRGGSCIFLHIWKAPGKPTSGCIAAQESHVEAVQLLFDGLPSAVAILPRNGAARLAGCTLPQALPD